MVSNQFHKHKNHKVILEALADLKRQNLNICVAMTGKLPDDPSSAYMSELHRLLDEHELRDQIRFLGVIPRAHQLALMRHARAIIQPSLFEGWSTVIEDARSLQVPVIASSLPVNIEQLGDKGTYFEPHDSDQLADILKSFPQRDLDEEIYAAYQSRMKAAARELMEILSGTKSA